MGVGGGGGGRRTDVPNRLFMKGVEFSSPIPFQNSLCSWYSRSIFTNIIPQYVLLFSTLQPKKKEKRKKDTPAYDDVPSAVQKTYFDLWSFILTLTPYFIFYFLIAQHTSLWCLTILSLVTIGLAVQKISGQTLEILNICCDHDHHKLIFSLAAVCALWWYHCLWWSTIKLSLVSKESLVQKI